MLLYTLLGGVTVNGDGPTVNPQGRMEYGVVQVDLGGGSATVKIQGRISPNMPWLDIYTFTTSDSARMTLFPNMKANVSGYVSGTIRAEMVE